MRVLLVAAALASGVAAAQASGPSVPSADAPIAPAPAPTSEASASAPLPPPPAAPNDITHWGVNVDVGVPDGIAIGADYRPWYFLRVGAAGTYNILGFGVRGSLTLIPFKTFITPTLNFDYGHYFQGDITSIVKAAGLPFNAQAESVAKNVSYDYVNAHLGVEIGSPQHFMFFLRVGASYLQATIANIEALLNDPTLEAQPAVIRAIAPSLKLGVIAYF